MTSNDSAKRLSRMPRGAIANTAVAYMRREGMTTIGWGDYGPLDDIASDSGYRDRYRTHPTKCHPLNVHIAILNYLERDPRFEKFLYRCWVGNREALVRAFWLKEDLDGA